MSWSTVRSPCRERARNCWRGRKYAPPISKGVTDVGHSLGRYGQWPVRFRAVDDPRRRGGDGDRARARERLEPGVVDPAGYGGAFGGGPLPAFLAVPGRPQLASLLSR